jgi:Zn-dependent peptidase ImmA (M78 family)
VGLNRGRDGLTHDEFPIIMVNNSTPYSRQVFTLFHEVAQLLFGISSIRTVDGRFVDRMSGPDKSIEAACNKFAAEFLVPSDAFPWGSVDSDPPIDAVPGIARRFQCESRGHLRRILDRGWIDPETYRGCVQS